MIKAVYVTVKKWLCHYWQHHRANAVSVLLHLLLLLAIIIGLPELSASNSTRKSAAPLEIISASIVTMPNSQASPPPVEKPLESPKPVPTPPKPIEKVEPSKPVEKAPLPKVVPKTAELPTPKVTPPLPKVTPKVEPVKPKNPPAKPTKTPVSKPVTKSQKQTVQQKQQAAKALQQMALSSLQATADQLQEAQAQAARLQTLQEKYLALIQQTIRANWINPFPNSQYQVVLTILLDTQGNVQAVNIVKSSGNNIFDRQVIFAVRKSSPLPMPTDPELVKQFTNITLTFSGSDGSP